MPINGDGAFERVWRFVNQFAQGDDINRADHDIALDDLAVGVNQALSDAAGLPDLTDRVSANETAITDLASDLDSAASFSLTWFDDVAAFEADRSLTYSGDGTLVAEGDYVSLRTGVLLQVADASASAHHQNDHQTEPVKVFEAGHRFTTLQRFTAAVARGEVYRTGATVTAGGTSYVFANDANTNIAGLTGWRELFVQLGSASDLSTGNAAFLALARGTPPPQIGNASVTNNSIAPGFYVYSTLATSPDSGGPNGVQNGIILHVRRASGGGEMQMCFVDFPTNLAGRTFTRSRTSGAWSEWLMHLRSDDILDEDSMVSNSDVKAASQQSLVAYLLAQVPIRTVAIGNLNGNGQATWNFNNGFNATPVRNSAGNYSITFATPQPDAEYVIGHSVKTGSSGDVRIYVRYDNQTANGFTILGNNVNGVAADIDEIALEIKRAVS